MSKMGNHPQLVQSVFTQVTFCNGFLLCEVMAMLEGKVNRSRRGKQTFSMKDLLAIVFVTPYVSMRFLGFREACLGPVPRNTKHR